MALDYHQKLDIETKIQLIVLELDKIKTDIGNLSTRLKNLENLKLPQELQILQAEVRELKKKVLEKSDLTSKIKKIINK